MYSTIQSTQQKQQFLIIFKLANSKYEFILRCYLLSWKLFASFKRIDDMINPIYLQKEIEKSNLMIKSLEQILEKTPHS